MANFNRRDYFRHTFPIAARPRVELRPLRATGSPLLSGPAVDLSLDGIAILLPTELSPMQRDQLWSVSFHLPGEANPLTISGNVVHWHRAADGYACGIQFCGLEAPSQAEARRVLWRFLLTVPRPETDGLAPYDDFDDVSIGIMVDDPTPAPALVG